MHKEIQRRIYTKFISRKYGYQLSLIHGQNPVLYTVLIAWGINACLTERTETFWQTWAQTHQQHCQATIKIHFSSKALLLGRLLSYPVFSTYDYYVYSEDTTISLLTWNRFTIFKPLVFQGWKTMSTASENGITSQLHMARFGVL